MRVVDIGKNEIEALTSITREEAEKHLESGKDVLCKVDSRIFEKLESPIDLFNIINLEKNGIYGRLKFYI